MPFYAIKDAITSFIPWNNVNLNFSNTEEETPQEI